jgi:hypothetical protein
MKTIRISDENLIAAVEAAAKRHGRSFPNFILRWLDLTKVHWMRDDWDKDRNIITGYWRN